MRPSGRPHRRARRAHIRRVQLAGFQRDITRGATPEERADEQAIVREEWADRMTALRDRLDYAAQFTAASESYSEADEDGNLIVHPARG